MGILSEISLRIHILRYRLGVRKTLPAAAINRVKISESGEPLVDISKCQAVFIGTDLASRGAVYVRQGVQERLIKAAVALPDGYRLKIMSAYRPLVEQQELWNRQMSRTRAEHPDATEAELVKINRRLVAEPHRGFGGHQTGGAVDVTLCDENGADLGLGKWLSTGPGISKTETQRLRRVLRHAMCGAGFVNYPAEWWHFCYGDRMWAAYSKRSKCFYGLIESVEPTVTNE